MSRYSVEYDPRTELEIRKLPVRIQREIARRLEYLSASPFRSHPGIQVKPTAGVHGVWHFHVGKNVRVYYLAEGATLWVVKVERSAGVTHGALREIRKRV